MNGRPIEITQDVAVKVKKQTEMDAMKEPLCPATDVRLVVLSSATYSLLIRSTSYYRLWSPSERSPNDSKRSRQSLPSAQTVEENSGASLVPSLPPYLTSLLQPPS
jgi:hypothetical protein